jgi:hypothetical protein
MIRPTATATSTSGRRRWEFGMDFEIKGIDRTTGDARWLKLSAASEPLARRQAEARGIDVSSLRALVPPQAPPWRPIDTRRAVLIAVLLLLTALASHHAVNTVAGAARRYVDTRDHPVRFGGGGQSMIVGYGSTSDGSPGAPISTWVGGSSGNSGDAAQRAATMAFWKMILSYASAVGAVAFPILALVTYLRLKESRRPRAIA